MISPQCPWGWGGGGRVVDQRGVGALKGSLGRLLLRPSNPDLVGDLLL